MVLKVEKVLSCIVVFVILMSTVPGTAFAVDGGDNSMGNALKLSDEAIMPFLSDNKSIMIESGEKPKEIKFKGTHVLSNCIIGFTAYYFKIDEVLEGSLPVGDEIRVFVSLGGSMLDNYDVLKTGDKAEVYAEFEEELGKRYDSWVDREVWAADITESSNYYVKKLESELSLSINVWTDKSKYNVGDTVLIYYQTNKECTAKLTVTKPDGTQVVVGGPNDIPVCTRSKSATAGYPTGTRTVTFDAGTDDESKIATCYFDVVEEQKPDLIIQDISVDPYSPQKGATVTYTVKIKNQGSGSAGSSTVKYYIDGSYVASDSVPSLSAGSTSTQAFIWTANTCGNVQVKAVADATSKVSESNEGNNYKTETVSVICNKPDLIVSSINFNPNPANNGDNVIVSVTVKNQGTGDAGSHYEFLGYPDRYTLLKEWYCSGLNAGASNTFTHTLENVQQSDTYEACADWGQVVQESNENNNCLTAYLEVKESEQKPDLVIQDITWDKSSPKQGDTITYTVTIKNQGSGSAGTSTVKYYIDGSYVTSDSVTSLSAGSTSTQTFTWTANKCGNVLVKAVADANNAVSESNEGNNERTETVSISCNKPDLIIQDISWNPANPEQGDTVTFTVTIKNQGAGSAGTSTVKYYIDGSYVTSDSVTSLSAGSTSTQTFTWTANKCGNVQVKAIADAPNAVSESNEGNNEKTKTVSVTCPDQPITSIVIDGRSKDCEDYAPLNVFFRGSKIHVKLENADEGEHTFDYLLWIDDGNLDVDKDDQWIAGHISSFTSDKQEFDREIPKDCPIGLYRLQVDIFGKKYTSNNFFVIFDHKDVLSRYEIKNYCEDDLTGRREGFLLCFPKFVTNHHSEEVMICMASAAALKSRQSTPHDTKQAMSEFQNWINDHTKPESEFFPPSSIKALILKIKSSGRQPADCDVSSAFLISLSRASGIPARMIHGSGIESTINPFDLGWFHAWVEAYYEGSWQVWDPVFRVTFEEGDDPLYSPYLLHTRYLKKNWDLAFYTSVKDELGKSRSSDYGVRPLLALSVSCPVNVTITDQHDRTISDDGTNEIPDADLLITEDAKIFYLPADLTYSTEIDAYDTGTFNFTRVSPIGNDISITKFENISITSNTKASVDIEPGVTDYTMSIDYNGDGTTDEEKSPDVNETIGQDSYSIQLHTDWNLISLPIMPHDSAVLNVMSSVGSNWNSVWSYETGNWKRYDLTGPDFLNDLTTIEPGKGYWIDMKSEDTLSVSGSEPTTKSISLSAGWNLVGYNSLSSKSTTSAMNSVTGNWNSVWSYEAGNWKRYDLTGPDFLNDLTSLEPGKGYWIDMKSSGTWTLGA